MPRNHILRPLGLTLALCASLTLIAVGVTAVHSSGANPNGDAVAQPTSFDPGGIVVAHRAGFDPDGHA